MAEASKETVTVQEPVYEDRITLTLTQQEAQVVRDVFGSIIGSPTESRRALADGVYDALRVVTESRWPLRDFDGRIDFNKTDPETW